MPVLAAIVAISLAAFVAEGLSSALLLYRYRVTGEIRDGRHLSSTLTLGERALARLGALPAQHGFQVRREVDPFPFLQEDDYFGYVPIPGEYRHMYHRRPRSGPTGGWETLPIKVTVNADRSRWTGRDLDPGLPTVFILGDSFAFGIGVNDEQSFAYHLQSAFPSVNVRLFALGGYGLAQSYLRFRLLLNELTESDVIVLTYADFYDVRGVSEPSRLRDIAAWNETLADEERIFRRVPKAELSAEGELNIRLISEDCDELGDYCRSPDPAPEEMTRVSAALVRAIDDESPAPVFLLAMNGQPNNPLYAALPEGVRLVSVLPENMSHFIQDDVAGFDPHPGPYWHYFVAKELEAALRPHVEGL